MTSATLKQGVHPDPMQRDNAAATMAAAAIKGMEDLPEDHPMARRQAMLEQIQTAHLKSEGVDTEQFRVVEPGDADNETSNLEPADIKAPDISAFTDAPRPAAAKPAPKQEAVQDDSAAQLAAQTKKEVILDPETLNTAMVRVKIDGVDELIPASKVLAQYQKGAAADVRLAEATKTLKDAKAAAETAVKDAQQRTALAETPTEQAASVQSAAAAMSKFKQASEALMLEGDPDKAAQLFSEAVAAAVIPQSTNGRRSDAIDQDALVQRVSARVEQQLTTKSALDRLFTDYPEIKAKKAFAMIADEYIGAFVSQGFSDADAIAKAGEAIGEEYNLGKFKVVAPEAKTSGRQLKTNGPTTMQAKLDAKNDLDNLPSGHARSTSMDVPEQTAQDVIAEMAKQRPGARVI